MKPAHIPLLFLLLVCLCGCQAQLEKEYTAVIPHEEQYEADQYSDALTAENYLGLKNAILGFVEAGTDYGVMRIYHYDGDLSTDLANAVYEVCNTDALGAYAVEHMTYDYARIVSYYELYFYITFRVSPSRLSEIRYCSSSAELETELENVLLQYRPYSAIRIANFQDFSLEEVMHRLFLSHPEMGSSEPTYVCRYYPESGIQRIMELTVQFPYDIMEMQSRQASLAQRADEIVASLERFPTDTLRVERMYRWFMDRVTYIGEDSPLFSSAFNALVNRYGSSMGMALSVQLLCNRLSIPCMIVEGSYQNEPWNWNMVFYDTSWHHIDIAQGLIQSLKTYTARYDDQMDGYDWDAAAYPVCTGSDEDAPDNALPTDADGTADTISYRLQLPESTP